MRRWGALGIVVVFCALTLWSGQDRPVDLSRSPDVAAPATTDASVAPTTTSTPSAPETTAPTAPTATAPPVVATASSAAVPWTVDPYRGFGAWLDTYDWSPTFVRDPAHLVGPAHIDHMATEGVQTLYIQASRWNSPTDILDPAHLQPILDRAEHHGISVVVWYLPTLVDVDTDLRRILAVASLPGVDGIGIDIEARDVADVAERNRRLVDLSARLRAAMPGRSISAIVLEPVLIEDVNPRYWPAFPWTEIAPYYDVWLPMSYWTNRKGPWRAAHAYTAENIVRVRERIGRPDAPVHTIGGIGDKTTVPDLEQMLTAAVQHGAMGGSIYDYRTSRPEFWDVLRRFRDL